jgi:hypothetical protein
MSDDSDNPFREEGDDADIPTFIPRPPSPTAPSRQSRLDSLRAREAQLTAHLRRLQGTRAELTATANFPPFWPVIVFDLARDIPSPAHPCVRAAFFGLAAAAAAGAFNVLTVLCTWGLPSFRRLRSLVIALIQGFAIVYATFNYSFSALYAACRRRDIPFSWVVIQVAIVAWATYLAVGFPDSGCVGLATFLDLLAKSNSGFSKAMAFVNTALAAAAAYCQFVALYRAQTYQKVSGQNRALPGTA